MQGLKYKLAVKRKRREKTNSKEHTQLFLAPEIYYGSINQPCLRTTENHWLIIFGLELRGQAVSEGLPENLHKLQTPQTQTSFKTNT